MNIDTNQSSSSAPLDSLRFRAPIQAAEAKPEVMSEPAIRDRVAEMVQRLKEMPEVRPDAVEAGRQTKDARELPTRETAERLARDLTPFADED